MNHLVEFFPNTQVGNIGIKDGQQIFPVAKELPLVD